MPRARSIRPTSTAAAGSFSPGCDGCRSVGRGPGDPAGTIRATPSTRSPTREDRAINTQDLIPNLITVAIFLLIAFPIHEFAHAAVAYLQGDATAKLFGRLTINPIVHFDPLGGLMTIVSVLFTGFIIGWAKPTPVNPANLHDRRNGEVLVALAGPASNFVMALVGAFVFRVLDVTGVELVDASGQATMVGFVAYNFVVYNVLLAIFNFIPVPPLDGSALLYRILTPRQAWQVRPFLTQYGIFVVLAVVLLVSRPLGELIYGLTNVLVGV